MGDGEREREFRGVAAGSVCITPHRVHQHLTISAILTDDDLSCVYVHNYFGFEIIH